MLRRPPAILLFLLSGICAALLVRVDGANPDVHLRFVGASAAFLLVGGAVEELLGLAGAFFFHRIVVGQLALATWFYARSTLPGPGVGRAELAVLVAISAAILWRRRRRAIADPAEGPAWPSFAIWASWWASTLVFVGVWSGRLETPASDTDLHAWFARLTVLAGRVVRTQAPWSDAPVGYPSGFSVLNALWSLLSGVHPVQVVDCQVALQACLVTGLALEVMFALRGKVAVVPALLVIAAAHFLFALPVNPEMALLEGTARLAHKALLVFPLTFAARAGSRTRATALVSAACAGFAFALNPAQLAAEVPVLLATALVIGFVGREKGAHLRYLLAGLVASLLFISADAWVRSKASLAVVPTRAASGPQTAVRLPPLALSAAARGAFSRLVAGRARGCIPSAQCRPELDPISRLLAPSIVLVAGLWLWRSRGSRAAAFVLATFAATLAATALYGAVDAALEPREPIFAYSILRFYVAIGLIFSTAPLLLLELAAGLALLGELLSRLRAEGDVLAAAACAAIFAVGAAASGKPAGPLVPAALPSSLGPLDAEDVALARDASAIVPADELVLLPGFAGRTSPAEDWQFAVASSRAVPLYGTSRFAFFLGQGTPGFAAAEYRRRVCRTFDLGWLAARGVRWILVSESTRRMSCVHAWDLAAPLYFEERLRRGDKALYRLRDDRLALAARDPALDVPLGAALPAPAGEGFQGEVWTRGPAGVAGFACDRGVAAPATIELELTAAERTLRELHGASLPAGPRVRAACGGGDLHGFAFAPSTAPPGDYRARLVVRDAAGTRTRVLAEGFALHVE